jgi:putative endonuclease
VSYTRIELGARGEQLAARWYEQNGYAVVDRNWRCRNGEIDLIVARPGELVFCEVKTRASARFGTGLEAVHPAKARKVRQLAASWMAAHPGGGRRVRFDVVGVTAGAVEVVEGGF